MHARCCLRSGLQRMEFYKFSLVQLYAGFPVPLLASSFGGRNGMLYFIQCECVMNNTWCVLRAGCSPCAEGLALPSSDIFMVTL